MTWSTVRTFAKPPAIEMLSISPSGVRGRNSSRHQVENESRVIGYQSRRSSQEFRITFKFIAVKDKPAHEQIPAMFSRPLDWIAFTIT